MHLYGETVDSNAMKEPAGTAFVITKISIDHLIKQLNQCVAGIHEKNNHAVRDVLVRIALVYGTDNADLQDACLAAFRLNCTRDEEITKIEWDEQTAKVQTYTCDPLEELQSMCSTQRCLQN